MLRQSNFRAVPSCPWRRIASLLCRSPRRFPPKRAGRVRSCRRSLREIALTVSAALAERAAGLGATASMESLPPLPRSRCLRSHFMLAHDVQPPPGVTRRSSWRNRNRFREATAASSFGFAPQHPSQLALAGVPRTKRLEVARPLPLGRRLHANPADRGRNGHLLALTPSRPHCCVRLPCTSRRLAAGIASSLALARELRCGLLQSSRSADRNRLKLASGSLTPPKISSRRCSGRCASTVTGRTLACSIAPIFRPAPSVCLHGRHCWRPHRLCWPWRAVWNRFHSTRACLVFRACALRTFAVTTEAFTAGQRLDHGSLDVSSALSRLRNS